uniref:Uncharacterized protein n=1 Tax=Hemiselmis andersenii TaxID=464988 RepID=A0A7S1GSJ2_HEMAN|mmetsp:Transcript_11973/g.29059  ORF Transcript_11973/g.29059 Transcript_11973/m.29059 type:complete len:201 (+) Transcript_11973:192-794(+)
MSSSSEGWESDDYGWGDSLSEGDGYSVDAAEELEIAFTGYAEVLYDEDENDDRGGYSIDAAEEFDLAHTGYAEVHEGAFDGAHDPGYSSEEDDWSTDSTEQLALNTDMELLAGVMDRVRIQDVRQGPDSAPVCRSSYRHGGTVRGVGWGEGPGHSLSYTGGSSGRTYDTSAPPPQPCFNCGDDHWRRDCGHHQDRWPNGR